MTDRVVTAEDFTPHVGKDFTPLGQHRSVTLVSVEINTFAGADSLSRTPFSLLFSGPPNDVLPEGLYAIAIPNGPALTLYISPIHTHERSRQDYQAVFN
jgi:hypothetical protein